jgi:hypothetical protein
MERQFIIDNNRERARLNELVDEITDEELNLVIYKEGWTIAVILAHLTLYDERRLVLTRKWKEKGLTPSSFNNDEVAVLNDALISLFLEIPPRKAANLSTHTAEVLDHELKQLSPEVISAIEALGDHHALDRSVHRKIHLDEIEAALKARRPDKLG